MKYFCLKMLITSTFIHVNTYASDLGFKNPLYDQKNPNVSLGTPSIVDTIDEDEASLGSDRDLDQSTIDLGQYKADELDPFALGNAIIKDRIEKNQSLINFLNDESICPQEKYTRYGQMVGSSESYFKGIEEATEEFLVSCIGDQIEAVQNDIDVYSVIKRISDNITKSTTAQEKNNAIRYLYDYLSFQYKKCEFDENVYGSVSVYDFREKFFYKILRDILCKADIEKYDFLTQYTTFTVGRYQFNVQLMVDDLLAQSTKTWPLLKGNPLLKMSSTNRKIVQRKAEVEAERERIFTKRNAILQRLAQKTDAKNAPAGGHAPEEHCRIFGLFLTEIMMDWRATDEEIKAEACKLNQWLIENKGMVASQMPRSESDKIYNFINPPQESVVPVTLPSKKHAKRKASVRSETDSVEGSQMPRVERTKVNPTLPDMKPYSLASKLAPLTEQCIRTEPKQKTRGEARVDEIKTEDEDEEESMSPTLYFADATEYPDWIEALIVNKHLKIRQSISNFLSEKDLKGGYQQEGDKYVFSLLSPIDGEVYAETFHNPHKTVGQKSWPSWRYALYNLLVKSRIIEGVIR